MLRSCSGSVFRLFTLFLLQARLQILFDMEFRFHKRKKILQPLKTVSQLLTLLSLQLQQRHGLQLRKPSLVPWNRKQKST